LSGIPTPSGAERATSDFRQRIIGAARLDAAIYEEVEHDVAAAPQAFAVVMLASIAAALPELGSATVAGVVGALVTAVLAWVVWAFLTYAIGTRLLPEPQTHADFGELLRTLGFAAAPGIVQIVGVIPPLRPVAFLAAELWTLAAMVVAVRQALDYTSTLRAIGVCVIGWVVQVVIALALLSALVSHPTSTVAAAAERSREPAAGALAVVRPSGIAPPVR